LWLLNDEQQLYAVANNVIWVWLMDKLKLFSTGLIVVLIISIGAAVYVASQNTALTDQKNVLDSENTAQVTKLEMVSLLSQIQVQTEKELQQMGNSLVYASEQLSQTGLSGDQARAVISALAASSSFTIEAATQNLNRTMITVEPAAFYSSEGKTIGPQKWLNTNPNGPITPSMTPVLPLITGHNGVSLAAPIFDPNQTLLGTVSLAFDHVALLNSTVTSAIAGTNYAVTVSQTNSTIIYDTDTSQIGKALTDPAYAAYPELLSFAHRVAEESSGYGTYKFTLNDGSAQVVNKECYWITINAYGGQWRLAIIHAINT
jgi:hypothetical protein